MMGVISAYRAERLFRERMRRLFAYWGEHEAPDHLRPNGAMTFEESLWRAVRRRMKDKAKGPPQGGPF